MLYLRLYRKPSFLDPIPVILLLKPLQRIYSEPLTHTQEFAAAFAA